MEHGEWRVERGTKGGVDPTMALEDIDQKQQRDGDPA